MEAAPEKPKRDRPFVKPAPEKALAADEAATLSSLIQESLKRKIDGLRLYRPTPKQQEFHACTLKERLIRGGNRSGKTTAAAADLAMDVTGVNKDAPSAGIAYLVGKDGKEVANVMYKLLFRAGAFKMIRDLETKEWRAYDPTTDYARRKEVKPAPPFVPPRLVKMIAWENKKANLPAVITLHNGWELHFFSSNSAPPHGSQIDRAWFDEEILNQNWYSEVSARLVDRDGRFVWSATPQAGTAQLYELHERADSQLRLPKEKRNLQEFHVTIYDNKHITPEQREEFESKLSVEEIAIRIHGEFASHGIRVFPEFSEATHICPHFSISHEWTIYVAIDPGRQVCAALFLAVPPPEEAGDYAYAFDELYIRQCSAELFGQEMAKKCRGRTIEAFVIDHQEGRKVETGSGRSVEEQYADSLKKHGIVCNRTGSDFTWGAADPQGGVEAVREWLQKRQQSGPKLRVLADTCPNFVWEMKRYWYERDRDGRVTDKPRERGPVHLCACMRYLVQDEPVWKSPEKKGPRPGEVWKKAQELMHPKGSNRALNLGPGSFSIGVGVR